MDKLIYTAFNTVNNIHDNNSVRSQNSYLIQNIFEVLRLGRSGSIFDLFEFFLAWLVNFTTVDK